MTLRLFVGNQRFSSWSLRPWICLREGGVPFETVVLRFDDPTFAAKVPSGTKKVPVLVDGDLVIPESLAICEYAAELVPALWPGDRAKRAEARALSSEMHAGFAALRTECSMDVCRTEAPGAWPLTEAARRDVARIDAIWSRAAGPFLFGRFGVVDAMFAPVVTRFLSYGITPSAPAKRYVDAVRALPSMDEWYRAGDAERAAGWRHAPGPHRSPRDFEEAMDFALRWAEAWNRRDAEAVLAHFADDCVFTSPLAKTVTGSAEVKGKEALRAYWSKAIERRPPGLRFEVERVEPAPDVHAITIRYVRRDGDRLQRAAEVLVFDPRTGLVSAGEAYYGAEK